MRPVGRLHNRPVRPAGGVFILPPSHLEFWAINRELHRLLELARRGLGTADKLAVREGLARLVGPRHVWTMANWRNFDLWDQLNAWANYTGAIPVSLARQPDDDKDWAMVPPARLAPAIPEALRQAAEAAAA